MFKSRKLFVALLALTFAAGSANLALAATQPPADADAIIAHLQFLGYKCEKKENKINVKHDSKLGFDIIAYKGGILVKAWFAHTEDAISKRDEFLNLVNMLNNDASSNRYYLDKDTDLIVEAWYPGAYNKEMFTNFMTAWEDDFVKVVKKYYDSLSKFIK